MTSLCLLTAGFAVYLKRKTLIRLLFTDKKTTLEKLRYPGSGHLSKTGRSKHCPRLGSFPLGKKRPGFLGGQTGLGVPSHSCQIGCFLD